MKENNNCSVFLHNWSKWIDINITNSDHIYIQQIKECKICGIKKGRSVCYVNQVK